MPTDPRSVNCARLLPSVGCCIFAFVVGLIFVQRSGNYFVTMFDDYSATLPLTVVVILETSPWPGFMALRSKVFASEMQHLGCNSWLTPHLPALS